MLTPLKNITIRGHEITWPKPPVIIGKGAMGKIYKVQYKETDVIIKSSKVKIRTNITMFKIVN